MASKELRIKLGILKRIKKDIETYEKEGIMQSDKIEKMRNENKSIYDIKKQEEVLQETNKMIPDCQKRLHKALDDLQIFLNKNQDEPEVQNSELLKEALELVQLLTDDEC